MNNSTAPARNGRHVARNGPKRPASIAELAEVAMLDLWDDTKDFKYYLRIAEMCRKEGKECARKGDLQGAFVQLTRAATLVVEKLPMHRDYNGMLNATQRQNLSLNGQDILDNLRDLKPALVDRYEKWVQKHSGHEHPDIAALTQALRERFQAQEREVQEITWKWEKQKAQEYVARRAQTQANALAADLEVQDAALTNPSDYMFSAAAAEAVKRKWQKKQLEAQGDDVEGTQREIAAAGAANPPDHTFPSKHTIVVSDAFASEEANHHHKSPSGGTSHRSQPMDVSSTFYRVDREDGPESLTPNANQSVYLPPENSQPDVPWIASSRKLRPPKRLTDLQFMMRMAKLRQQTGGTSITSSTPQAGEMYILGSPSSFVSSFSQSFSIASPPPAVEFPPTPVFTDERIF